MSVKFNVVERGNPGNPEAPKKFYPSVVSSGRVTVRDLAEMAASQSTLSTMDMMAAYESLLALIPKQLANGNVVELGDFGNFWLKNNAEGMEVATEVNSTHITNLLPRFNPGKNFKKLLRLIDFEKAASA
jgi:predicted histone-like DNA-binding protein